MKQHLVLQFILISSMVCWSVSATEEPRNGAKSAFETTELPVAAEQVFISENFQGWPAESASTARTFGTVTYYGDSIYYTLNNVSVMPVYLAKGDNGVTTVGAIQCQKVDPATSYFMVSGFPNVTKATFKHSYTGSSRGCIISAKGDGDADWVVLLNANTTSAAGQSNTFDINKNNVSLKFSGNLATQNAYLHDLIVYGKTDKVVPVLNSINYVNGEVIPHAGGSIRLVFSEKVVRGTGVITLGDDTIPEQNIVIADSIVTILYEAINTDASYVFNVPAGGFKNLGGTPTAATISLMFKTLDTVSPALSKQSIVNGANMPVNGFISFVMSEPCQSGALAATLGTKSITPAISGSNANLVYINYSGLDYDKDYTLSIPEGAITDLTGNVYTGTSLTFHTELEAKGDTLFSFTPSAANMPTTSGTVRVPMSIDTLEFGGVASAGVRNAESFTYAFKTNYVLLPELPSLGELSMYLQCGGGTVPQEFEVQKYNNNSSNWTTIETIILGTNDRMWFRSAAAQSSVSTRLRIQCKEAQLWYYTMTAYEFEQAVAVDDNICPFVVASVPVDEEGNTPINGTIKLTFNENVVPGSGDVILHAMEMTGIGDPFFADLVLNPFILGKTVTLPYVNLPYSRSFTLTVLAGAFKDAFDSASVAFTLIFSTKAKPQVTPRLFDFVVSQGGHGNGTTIQSAFDAVPNGNVNPFIILVLPGVYDERPSLAANKTNVSLIGVNRNAVVITGNKRSGVEGFTTSTCQTVEIFGDNFYCENITMQNTAGLNAGQAVALKVYADKAVFKNVKLTSYQDTHLTSNIGTHRQYYLNCDIRGTVDFIFGNGVAFFDETLIYLEDRTTADVIVAPATSVENTYGYVFNNCTIDGASSQEGAYNLGRPWQNAPRAVFLNTKMNILPSSGAWISMGTIPALFAEYGSVNASNNPVDVSGRNAHFSYTNGGGTLVTGSSPKTVLTTEEAAVYTRANVLGGSDAWLAETKTETTAVPDSLRALEESLVWNPVDGAMCYGVRVDDTTFFATVTPSLPLSIGVHSYSVVSFSEFGAIGDASSIVIDYVSDALNKVSQVMPSLRSTMVSESMELVHGEEVKSLDVYSISGQKMLSVLGTVSTVSVSGLKAGFYLVNLTINNGKTISTKFFKN